MKALLTTAGILGSCYFANADVKWSKYDYFENNQGLNDSASTVQVGDKEATAIQNIIFDTGGALRKRYGYITLPQANPARVASGTALQVNGIAYFKTDTGNRWLVGVANRDGHATVFDYAYTLNGGLTYPDTIIDGAVTATSYTNTEFPQFVEAFNTLIFTLGNSTKPYMWTGTGGVQVFTSDANCPTSNIICYHKNQLFLVQATNPSSVSYSNLATTLATLQGFTSTYVFTCNSSDGTQIRALLSAYDSLYIFKDNSIWRLSGSSSANYYLEKTVDGVGTLSASSPVATSTGIYFTSSQGSLFQYDGAYTVTPISQRISNTINTSNKQVLNQVLGLGYSTYRFNDSDYYATESINTATNNWILVFDTKLHAWTKLYGITPSCWVVGDDANANKVIYYGDYNGYLNYYPSAGYIDGPNIASSAIAASYTSKWYMYPEVCLGNKYWRVLKVYALSQDGVTLHAQCSADYASSGKVIDVNLQSSQSDWDVALWDVGLWGGASVIVGRGEIEEGKEMFQVQFYNNDVNAGFTLLGWSTFIEPTTQAP